MIYQRVSRGIAMSKEVNEAMRELLEEGASTSSTIEPPPVSQDRAHSAASIEPTVHSDLGALLERMSGLSLAEMDRSIQELQKARNFLRNEKERMRLEMAEYLRLTQTAMGSAKAVSASIASFGTVAEEVGRNPAVFKR
jgi:hypothetical protein